MKNNTHRLPGPSGIFTIVLLLTACGGGSDGEQASGGNSGGENSVTEHENIVVMPESGDQDVITDTTPPQVTAGSALTASVTYDDFDLYRVPSGSQIVLKVISGTANLYLYNSLEFESENLLCASRVGFGESACSATNNDGELYALVYGVTAADYTISSTDDCSVTAINGWVDRNMRDYYLYADQVPPLNPASYDSPAALLAELRFDTLDPFSSIGNAQSQSDFSNLGITKSLGNYWSRDTAGQPRIAFVYKNSPFGQVGIKRGDIIVSVNGELWNDMSGERYNELIGSSDNPLPTTWTFIDNDTGEQKTVVVQLEEFTINTVLHSELLTPVLHKPARTEA